MNITCPYCKQPAKLQTGKQIYPHRKDLHNKKFWTCNPCNAYVGCHNNTTKPLGRLANAELRKAKMQTHAIFDPIWQHGQMNRTNAYKWLANKLGIKTKHCHIGMFDLKTCQKAIETCHKKNQTK